MNKSLTTLVLGLLLGLSSVAVAGDSKETNDAPAKPVAEDSKVVPDGIKALNFKNLAGFKYEYPYEEPKGKP